MFLLEFVNDPLLNTNAAVDSSADDAMADLIPETNFKKRITQSLMIMIYVATCILSDTSGKTRCPQKIGGSISKESFGEIGSRTLTCMMDCMT